MAKLSAKQQAFIDEYLKDFNATQAAIRAGYSERSAANIGWENVRKPEIAEAISRRVEERAMSAEEALIRLAQEARADYGDFLEMWDGGFKIAPERAIQEGKGHLIKKLGFNQYGKPEIELHNQQRALELIGKAHGMFREVRDDNVSGEMVIRIKRDSSRYNPAGTTPGATEDSE